MTALPYQSLPFLDNIIETPILMVAWAAFGVPLVIFLLILLSKLYRQYKISSYIDTVIFSSLFFTWIVGFILLIFLLFANVSGVKLYFIWITVFVSSLVFSIINNRALVKYLGLLDEKNPLKK